jgi:hypothetical protein
MPQASRARFTGTEFLLNVRLLCLAFAEDLQSITPLPVSFYREYWQCFISDSPARFLCGQ